MEDDGICMQCHATEGFSDASAEGVDSGYGSRHDTSSFVWLRQRSAAHGVLCDQCLDRLVESGDLAKYADRRGPLAHLPDTVLGAVFVLGADYGNRFVAAARLMDSGDTSAAAALPARWQRRRKPLRTEDAAWLPAMALERCFASGFPPLEADPLRAGILAALAAGITTPAGLVDGALDASCRRFLGMLNADRDGYADG